MGKRRSELNRAGVAIKWIEDFCRIPEGPDVGARVKLREWQKKELRKIYNNKAGTRRAIISFGRKNAKTSLAAFLLLLHLCGPEHKYNGQLFSAAQSRDQAALIFALAAKIVRLSPDLNAVVVIRDTKKELACPELGTIYRALSAEASTAYGISPTFIVHDELGQVRGPRSQLYEALETSTGAQSDPLSIIISTQAPSDSDLLSMLIDDALGGHDPRVVISLYTAPKTDDPFVARTIKKANPAFGDFLNAKEVLAMAQDAKRMPAREAEFRNLVLNQRVLVKAPFVSIERWKACAGGVADLRGMPVYGGLDLASVSDLTALVLIGKVGRVWHVAPTFWLPGEGLREKAEKDRVPYDLWRSQGFLQTTPGASVSYEYVAEYLRGVFDEYDVQKLGFDRWNMSQLRPWLLRAGFTEQVITDRFVEFGQGTQSMSPALRALEQAVCEQEIAHGGHPVLEMCAACAVVEGKDDANRKLSKNKSTGRIDGMVALTMAIGVAPLQAAPIDIEAMIARGDPPMKTRQVEPDDGESYADFMDRCGDELDENACQMIWDERAGDDKLVRKTSVSPGRGLEYVMSDETIDIMDDVIMSDGWDLSDFRKNPIALFGHNSDFIVGEWADVHVKDKQLRGTLKLAKKGTSDRINEVISLVDQGILRAVSVGFNPKEYKPRAKDSHGLIFTKQKLRETSLVAVPANPNALVVAKSLKISPETQQLVFAGQGTKNGLQRRGITGGHADRKSINRKGATMSLAQRITEMEKGLLEKTDRLAEFHETKGNGNYSDDDIENIDKTNAEIRQTEKLLSALRESERNMAKSSDDGGRSMVTHAAKPTVNSPRPFAVAAKKVDPIELFIRAGTTMILAQRERKPIEEIRRAVYGDDEATKSVLEWQSKAASSLATTTTVGWAAELVQQIVVDFMQLLQVQSIFAPLSAAGLSLSFGRNGRIIIPTRSRTPTIAGSFVGEGLPIPVRQGAFTSQTLTPKKMAVITTWTREIDEHSVPAIQGLLRDAIQYDTGVALDAILLDTNPATTVRPAGILNGVSGLTPTAGGGFNALTGDIKQLSGALLTGTLGNVRNPRWLMNPQQVNSAGLAIATGAGVFPYRDEISQGRLGGWPIIQSGTVPVGTVIAIDAADFVSVMGDGPRFEISDQATLHMEDTTPSDISTAGSPAVVAYPAKSMFQTDSMALRLVMPINWTIRRTGTVSWVAGVTW